MSLSRDDMMELMAYADGELEAEGRARVEALLARSEEARRVVAAIESPAIGAWLDAGLAAHAAKADGIADAVMLRLAADGGAAPVVRLDEARARRRTTVVAVVAGALALAAGGLLWVQSKREPSKTMVAQVTTAVSTAAPSVAAPAPKPLAPAQTAAAEAEGIEVNEVEAPAHDVSVYYLEPSGVSASADTNSVVIWIGDDTPSPGGAPHR